MKKEKNYYQFGCKKLYINVKVNVIRVKLIHNIINKFINYFYFKIFAYYDASPITFFLHFLHFFLMNSIVTIRDE